MTFLKKIEMRKNASFELLNRILISIVIFPDKPDDSPNTARDCCGFSKKALNL
jgi:hypothetical protein